MRDRRRKDERSGKGRKKASRNGDSDKSEEALDLICDVVEALFQDHEGNVYSSMVKQTIKRKRPNFSERYHGFRNFNELLETARDRGYLELQKDEKSGGYLIQGFGPKQ